MRQYWEIFRNVGLFSDIRDLTMTYLLKEAVTTGHQDTEISMQSILNPKMKADRRKSHCKRCYREKTVQNESQITKNGDI